MIVAAIEPLPRKENTITINFSKQDVYELPLTRIDVRWTDNERNAARHAWRQAANMLSLAGGSVTTVSRDLAPPGSAIHEMGGACMGHDPRASVTNRHNQLHDAANVFVTDGAFMSSTGDRNPSLTYMAFTARAAAYAAEALRDGRI